VGSGARRHDVEPLALVEHEAEATDQTAAGEALFTSLLSAVVAFDQKLSAGFSEDELGTLRRLLARLRTNAAPRPL
jgi:hypothetical protein